jgi:8-oxo-dGTP pyrophosphatase MutT (NUDIX family)
MQTIYLHNTAIHLVQEKPSGQSIPLEELKLKPLNDFFNEIEKGVYGNIVNIWGEQSNVILEYIIKNMPVVIAAGGLVQNPEKDLLFIKRKGFWDFPKGKPEFNESKEETAIREVEEECGITGLTIISTLPETHHIYAEREHAYILKKCIWYHMTCLKWENLSVQLEENITEARWVKLPVPEKILKGAFPSIRDMALYFQDVYLRPPLLRS